MSQNINIPDELKAIAEAKATFVHIGPSKPNESKTNEAEAKKPKITKLKETPVLPMDFDSKINAIKRIEQMNANMVRLEATKKLLEAFKLEESSNTHSQPHLIIKDSGYSGIEFKTYNVSIIREVLEHLENDVLQKINFVKEQIAAFELPKI